MKIFNPKSLSEIMIEKSKKEEKEFNLEKIPELEVNAEEIALVTSYVLSDTAMIAELTSNLLEDLQSTAEVLSMVLEKNFELEARIQALEGGN